MHIGLLFIKTWNWTDSLYPNDEFSWHFIKIRNPKMTLTCKDRNTTKIWRVSEWNSKELFIIDLLEIKSPELENMSLKQSSHRKSVNVHLWPHRRSTVEEKDGEETALQNKNSQRLYNTESGKGKMVTSIPLKKVANWLNYR